MFIRAIFISVTFMIAEPGFFSGRWLGLVLGKSLQIQGDLRAMPTVGLKHTTLWGNQLAHQCYNMTFLLSASSCALSRSICMLEMV